MAFLLERRIENASITGSGLDGIATVPADLSRGEVYKARDTRLNPTVAVKVSAERFSYQISAWRKI
jgi:hypothetical protein